MFEVWEPEKSKKEGRNDQSGHYLGDNQSFVNCKIWKINLRGDREK